jgi:small subunit ribosomal protein S19
MIINKKIEHSKKPPYIAFSLRKKINLLNLSNKIEIIKSWSRSSTITPQMIGHTISLYNGKKHIPIHITSYHIGYKLGEFVTTRTFYAHKNVNLKSTKKVKKKIKKS